MSNRLYKNYQVNLGMPFNIKVPRNVREVQYLENMDEEKSNSNEEKVEVENTEEILEKAREEAKIIVKEAEYEALKTQERIKLEAEEQKSAIFEEAWQEGYEQGINEGKTQYRELIEEAENLKAKAQKDYKEIMEGIEADSVNLILHIAKKVIGSELKTNRDSVFEMVKNAFEKCSNRESILLYINPEDYSYINENKERLISKVEGIQELEIRKDPGMKQGEFIVKTDYGNVDGGMETRLKKIEEAFKEIIG